MQTTTVTLGSLVDRALFELEAPAERGARVVMGSNHLENTTDTQFTLSSGEVSPSDLVEFGTELVLVTAKTADLNPIYTAQRGYYATTAAVQAAGTAGTVNPQFARRRVADAVDRSLTRLEALGVPLIDSITDQRETGKSHLILTSDVRRVLQVMYVNQVSGKVLELDGWRLYDNMPIGVASTGKMLKLPLYVLDEDEIVVVYSKPYAWETATFPDETAEVELPVGAESLPASYAAAFMTTSREVSRQELDRANEQSEQDPARIPAGQRLAQFKWQEFYRSLDETRRVVQPQVPNHRPYIKMPKVRV